MNITPEQINSLPIYKQFIVFIIIIGELWLDIAKVIWPILIWRILSVLKDIRELLKKE